MLSLRSRALIAKARRAIAECDAMIKAAGMSAKSSMPTDEQLASPWFLPDASLPDAEFAAVQQRHRQVMRKRYSPEQLKMIAQGKRAAMRQSASPRHKAAMAATNDSVECGAFCITELITAGPGTFGMSQRYASAIRSWAATKDIPPRELSRRLMDSDE